jgi:hypothetical protein
MVHHGMWCVPSGLAGLASCIVGFSEERKKEKKFFTSCCTPSLIGTFWAAAMVGVL